MGGARDRAAAAYLRRAWARGGAVARACLSAALLLRSSRAFRRSAPAAARAGRVWRRGCGQALAGAEGGAQLHRAVALVRVACAKRQGAQRGVNLGVVGS